MLRLVLCLIIVIFSALAGWSKASVYTNRIEELQNLTANLKYLEAEMGFRMEPIPVILTRLGESRKDSGGVFFSEVAGLLAEEQGLTLRQAWEKGFVRAYGENVLAAGDKRVVMELGCQLGQTDMQAQRRLFSHCFSGLGLQEEAARQEARIKGRMYRGLGVSIGVLAAVLLL